MSHYTCKLCGESVEGKDQKLHDVVDDCIFGMILAAHPDWKQNDGACPRCIEELKKRYQKADSIQWINS